MQLSNSLSVENLFREYPQAETERRYPGLSVVGSASELGKFREPGCAALILQRKGRAQEFDWLDAVPPEDLPHMRVVLPVEEVENAVRSVLSDAGQDQDHWVEDVASLARAFAGMMQVAHLRLRLDVVNTNACRKFHLDAVRARLVCTYRGTGTQLGWSEDGQAPQEVITVPQAAPVLLRGSLWPTDVETGLLHRSPPIEGSGETRLVLVLDPIFDLDEGA